MKILNLYAGIGGNRKLWGDEHEITAVEYDDKIADVYKNNFPNDNLIIGDAHQLLLENAGDYDFIWSSPPCQSHSKIMKATKHKKNRYSDLSLYQEILFLQHFYKGKFVVENVIPYYKPLVNPSVIIGRHFFWANFNIPKIEAPTIEGFINKCTVSASETLKDWLGLHYEGNIYYKDNHDPCQVLRNCVHPDLGLHILNCAIGSMHKYEQNSLFGLTSL